LNRDAVPKEFILLEKGQLFKVGPMRKILKYLDINSGADVEAVAAGEATQLHWVPQWIALFAGIIIQPFFSKYQQTHTWDFSGLPGWLMFSFIVAILIFPGVYRNSFDPKKPVVLQVIPIFASGMGWQSLLTTAVAVAAK
jgi:hypothetical protein